MSHKSDPLTLIQAANPVPDPDRLPNGPDSPAAQSLVEQITSVTAQQNRHPRRRRVILAAAAALAVLATAATWAFVTQPETTTEIQCAHSHTMSALSGDPIADCAAELERLGIEHGPLVAYASARGGVWVLEEDEDAPGWLHPLQDDFRQDVAIIELEAALNDVTTGLEAECYSTSDAVPIVERELNRVGLNWAIVVGFDPQGNERVADGASSCAYAIPTPDESQVMLISIDASDSDVLADRGEPPWIAPSEELQKRLNDECLTLAEAAVIAEELFSPLAQDYLSDAGLEDQDESYVIPITQTVDTGAACTRATVTVGGTVFVDLRGPSK